jgi:glycosyltransferase involved in cell wall biosynthesis
VDKNKEHTICHLTSVHPPFDIRIFHKECISLANSGYVVFLIAPIKDSVQVDGVTLIPIKLSKSRMVRMWQVTFKMYRKALSVRARIYHFHDPELMFTGVLLRLSGKKVLFDVHENVRLSLESKDWLPKFLIPILKITYFLVERIALLFYSKLILAEESYLNYYPKKKSLVVLNYPLPIGPIDAKREMGSPIRLVYSGVVHPLRGVWEMLELVQRMNELGTEVTLDLVGEVRPSTLEKELKQFLTEHDLSQKVFIHGKVDYKEVGNFLAKADIGLALLKPIPNYKESLPTKIFEYMQHGLPVITNDFPLYKNYVEASNTGICVNLDDTKQVLDKVSKLLKLPHRLNEMSENGPKVIEENYNWKSQEEKLLDLYSKL